MIDVPFDRSIRRIWADYLGCGPADTGLPGTSIVPRDGLAGTGAVHIWRIGQRAFAESDPVLAGPLTELLAHLEPDVVLTARHMRDAWGSERVGPSGGALAFYLRPENLVRREPMPPITLRRLTPKDAGLVQALNDACTPEEADEGYVAADHEIAFACMDGDRAVSVVSGYRRNGFMDMGSLTHPAYRGKRLAPAALAAACGLTFEIGLIPQYRCDVLNAASRRVAEVTGFKQCFTSEQISVIG